MKNLNGFLERSIRIVAFIDYDQGFGGGYQQAKNAALLLKKLPSELCAVEFVATRRSNIDDLRRSGIEAVFFPVHRLRGLAARLGSIYNLGGPRALLRQPGRITSVDRLLSLMRADIVYFTTPSYLALQIDRFNYLFTVWDLSHRDEVEFPEVRIRHEFERRELLYESALKKASGIFVDSRAGRENVVRRYCVDSERVHLMPFSPARATVLSDEAYAENFIDVRTKYDMPRDFQYVYYPAQFWSHKNHVFLLKGLHMLESRYGIRVGAVFTGRDFGNMRYVRSVAADLGLSDRVFFLGFVPDEDVPYLYRQSIALVMPTYFGPTNLPPLEAFSLGVPVLYPDLETLREQVGDAGLLIDLARPDSMADALYRLIEQPALRQEMIARGKRRLASLDDEDRLSTLERVLERYRARAACWSEEVWMS
ncbi:glycosyltransferase family 1 protein [Paraburkholderia bryophila]|uniref:glycosyltransferase family 4 protein n=1 Tax=Burkholderiaceae TaxID=119060 RepID=UPI000B2BECA7|nr:MULTISPECIES: glycosyltransferase family 1 protein [Burkholderiaceae]